MANRDEAKTGELKALPTRRHAERGLRSYDRLGRRTASPRPRQARRLEPHDRVYVNDYLEPDTEGRCSDALDHLRPPAAAYEGSGTGLLPGRDNGFSIGRSTP